ncbi:pentatricopeptide repeat-containing protein At2g30780 isoform X3 [Lathyrus oleraceus]|uniref:Pentatricopeptide repeat-containing protein n=1 Tax=Pisum sativum TaxID=3888 RepID=A0A9D4W2T3_PEA|nr:pentatricopeptide repeat-containing protein At2g30780-like isoform X3 [Pisum sativum]KAI5394077.1 hypothetical protein KIW84_060964 [Pisum sativum]
MAFRIRVSCIARKSYRRTPHNFFFRQHSNSSSTSNSNPLLLKLLHLPDSRIKTTLDHEFPSLPTSLLSLDFLITSLSPSSSQKQNLVLEWILEKSLKQNVKDHSFFSDLIFLCGKAKNVKLGMHVFSSMEAVGVKPTRNVDAILAWYSAKKAAGLGSDLRMFELVLTGCVYSKKFEIADTVFEEMMVSEIIPNGTILESMLKGRCEQKSLCRVEEFVKLVLDNGWEISETMVEMLIALYHEQERVEKMEELLETMTKYLVDSGVLLQIHCGILRMYAVLDRLDDVELSVGRMLKQGMSFPSSDDVEKVICSYFRKEAYDRLDIFLECIKNSYVLTRSTFDLLISGYRRANLHEKVDLVLLDMKSVGLA